MVDEFRVHIVYYSDRAQALSILQRSSFLSCDFEVLTERFHFSKPLTTLTPPLVIRINRSVLYLKAEESIYVKAFVDPQILQYSS